MSSEKVRLHKLHRLFLGRSQSYIGDVRNLCEYLIDVYRLRVRHQWHRDVVNDEANHISFLLARKRERSNAYVAKVLFILTCFTVFGSVFFGFLQYSDNSVIVDSGVTVLLNPGLLFPFLISSVVLLILLALGLASGRKKA